VIEFIEIHILNGQQMELESLGLEEMFEIYSLVAEYTQMALEN